VAASLPSLNLIQTAAQRGKGSFSVSLDALKMLNEMGYGDPDAGLVLDLVSDPSGAFMPVDQDAAEKRGIRFNHLFTFANMPLGRFRQCLDRSGNYERYLKMLYDRFNAFTAEGLMCRAMVSVSWDGMLYDCDFNQAAGLFLGDNPLHVSEVTAGDLLGRTSAAGGHCYAGTAGSGFT
jgi:radical SAM/Cys-rich protein